MGSLEEELQKDMNIVNVACALEVNEWQGKKTLQIEIKDLLITEDKKDDLLCQLDDIFNKATKYIEENNNPRKKPFASELANKINNDLRERISTETEQKAFKTLMGAIGVNDKNLALKVAIYANF